MNATEKKTRTFLLTNSFHGTSARVRVPAGRVGEPVDGLVEIVLTAAQARRAASALCGISDCCCGDIARNHRVDYWGHDPRTADVVVTVRADDEE